MKIYLVGGAVRDQLLDLPIKEKDWVVLGATPEQMLEKDYKPVGKDFPVFLHPKTKEEYALARTERKSGKGYTGFICYSEPNVTLEEDLLRRDLTINAIAQTEDGTLIDPYHGQKDIKNKILRHISPAFSEDPLRVLRVARFSAYLDDFTTHPDTLELMRQLSTSDEILTLSSERIWKELEKSLLTKKPSRFFETLNACSAMKQLFPEIKTIEPLKKAETLSEEPVIRLTTLLQPLSANELKKLAKKIQLPKKHYELSLLASNYFEDYQNSLMLDAKGLLDLLEKTDAFRREERFQQFLQVCEIIDDDKKAKEKTDFLNKALSISTDIDMKEILTENLSGVEIGEEIHKKRLNALSTLKHLRY